MAKKITIENFPKNKRDGIKEDAKSLYSEGVNTLAPFPEYALAGLHKPPEDIRKNINDILSLYSRQYRKKNIFYYTAFIFPNSENITFLDARIGKEKQIFFRIFFDILDDRFTFYNLDELIPPLGSPQRYKNLTNLKTFIDSLYEEYKEEIEFIERQIEDIDRGNTSELIAPIAGEYIIRVPRKLLDDISLRITNEVSKDAESSLLVPFLNPNNSIEGMIKRAGGNYLKICDYRNFRFKSQRVANFMKAFAFLLKRPKSGYVMRRIEYAPTSKHLFQFSGNLAGINKLSKRVKFNKDNNFYIYFENDLSGIRLMYFKNEKFDRYEVVHPLDSEKYQVTNFVDKISTTKVQKHINLFYFVKNYEEIFNNLQATAFGVRRRNERKNVIAALSARHFRPPGTFLELLDCLNFSNTEAEEIVREVAIETFGAAKAREMLDVNIARTAEKVVAETNAIESIDPELLKAVHESRENDSFLPNPDDINSFSDLFDTKNVSTDKFGKQIKSLGDPFGSFLDNVELFQNLEDGSKWMESFSDLLMVTAVTSANLGFSAAAGASGGALDPERFIKSRLSPLITGERLKAFLQLIPPSAYFSVAVSIGLLQAADVDRVGLGRFMEAGDRMRLRQKAIRSLADEQNPGESNINPTEDEIIARMEALQTSDDDTEEEVGAVTRPVDSPEPALEPEPEATEADAEALQGLIGRTGHTEADARDILEEEERRRTERRTGRRNILRDRFVETFNHGEERRESAALARDTYGTYLSTNSEGTNVFSRNYSEFERDRLKDNVFTISEELVAKIETELGIAGADLTPAEKIQLIFTFIFEDVLTCSDNEGGELKELLLDLILDFVGFDTVMEDFAQISEFLNAWDMRNVDFCNPPDLPFADFVFNFLLGNFNIKIGNVLDLLKFILSALLAALLAIVLGILSAIINLIVSLILKAIAFLNSFEPCDVMNFVRDVGLRVQTRACGEGVNLLDALSDESLSIFCRELLTKDIDPDVIADISCNACSILTPNQYLGFLRGQPDRQTTDVISNYLKTKANLPPEDRSRFGACPDAETSDKYGAAAKSISDEPGIVADLGSAMGAVLLPLDLMDIVDEIDFTETDTYCKTDAPAILKERQMNSEEFNQLMREEAERQQDNLDTLMGLMTNPDYIQNLVQQEFNSNPLLHPTRILAGADKKIEAGDDIPTYNASTTPIIDRDVEPFREMTETKFKSIGDGVGASAKGSMETISRNIFNDYIEIKPGIFGALNSLTPTIFSPVPLLGGGLVGGALSLFSKPPPKNYDLLSDEYKSLPFNIDDISFEKLELPNLEFGLNNISVQGLRFSMINQSNYDFTSPAAAGFIGLQEEDVEKTSLESDTPIKSVFTVNYLNSMNQLVQLSSVESYNLGETQQILASVKSSPTIQADLETNSLNYQYFKQQFKNSLTFETENDDFYADILQNLYAGITVGGLGTAFKNYLLPQDDLEIDDENTLNYGTYLKHLLNSIDINNLELDKTHEQISEAYFSGSFNQENTLKRFRVDDPAYIFEYLFTDDADLAVLDKALQMYADASFIKSSLTLINNIVSFGSPILLKQNGENKNIIKQYYVVNLLNDLDADDLKIPYLTIASDIARMKGGVTEDQFGEIASLAIEDYYKEFLEKMFSPAAFIKRLEEQQKQIEDVIESFAGTELLDSFKEELEVRKEEIGRLIESGGEGNFKTLDENIFQLTSEGVVHGTGGGIVRVIDRPSVFETQSPFNIGPTRELVRTYSDKNIAIAPTGGDYFLLLSQAADAPMPVSSYSIEFSLKENLDNSAGRLHAAANFHETTSGLPAELDPVVRESLDTINSFINSIFNTRIDISSFTLNTDDALYIMKILNENSSDLRALREFIFNTFDIKLLISNGILMSYDSLISDYDIEDGINTINSSRRNFFVLNRNALIDSGDGRILQITSELDSSFSQTFILEGLGGVVYVDIFSKEYSLNKTRLAAGSFAPEGQNYDLRFSDETTANSMRTQQKIFNNIFKLEDFKIYYNFILNLENLIYLKTIYYARKIQDVEDKLAKKSNFGQNRVLTNQLNSFRNTVAGIIKTTVEL